MKNYFLIILVLVSVNLYAQKDTLTYSLKLVATQPDLNVLDYVYPSINDKGQYIYKVEVFPKQTANPQFSRAIFKIDIENGKIIGRSDQKVNENETFYVKWNDIISAKMDAKVLINEKESKPVNSYLHVIKSELYGFQYMIASLKGLKPSAFLTSANNSVPTFGNKGTIEARGSIMFYPEKIVDAVPGGERRKQVKLFQWKLPRGWQISGATRNGDGTYHTPNLNVKIITDYVFARRY